MPGAKYNMMRAFRAKTPAVSSAITQILAGAALILGFSGVVAWFGGFDLYHRHFFDAGPIVAADNVVRVVFVAVFSWLIYAPGAAIGALVMPPDERAALTPPERAVLGFGIGLGIWHVAMLILGLAGLYYRPVIVGLCLRSLSCPRGILPTSLSPDGDLSLWVLRGCARAVPRRNGSVSY